jgi:Flp pilus assembly protein TadB
MRKAQAAAEAAGWTDLRTQTLWMCALILVVAGSLEWIAAPTGGALNVLAGGMLLLLAVLWRERMTAHEATRR